MTQIVTTPAVVADLQASFDALAAQLNGLLQEVSGAAASDSVACELLSTKVDATLAAVTAARSSIDGNSVSLADLSAATASVQTSLAALSTSVAAIPGGSVDTAALEQLIAANGVAIAEVLDTATGVSTAQGVASGQLTTLAAAVASIVGKVDSIAVGVSGIASEIVAIKSRLDVLEAGTPTEPNPNPTPTPEPTDLLPLAGFNAAGLGNNPQFAPGVENTHFRTFALRSYQPNYVNMWAGHLNPAAGQRYLVRLPYALERLFVIQAGVPVLQESYAALMEEVINQAGAKGGMTLLDAHNYCRWYQPTAKNADGSLKYPALERRQQTVNGVTIDKQWFPMGHAGCEVNYPILAQMYVKIAQRFGTNPHLFGYGLMNEPHQRGGADDGFDVKAGWFGGVQSLIDAVRSVDANNWITVGGWGYSTAKWWRANSDGLRNVTGSKIMFEAHQYPDNNGDGGGTWPKNVQHSINAAARVGDWTDFLNWCKEVGRPAFAGEFGCPIQYQMTDGSTYTVAGAAEYLEQLHALFDLHKVPRTQWLAGPGDDDGYANGMDRNDGTLKPNANSLFGRLGNTVASYGPTPA